LYCVANLSKTLQTNFYQNWSTFAEAMHKSILVSFYARQCSFSFYITRCWSCYVVMRTSVSPYVCSSVLLFLRYLQYRLTDSFIALTLSMLLMLFFSTFFYF